MTNTQTIPEWVSCGEFLQTKIALMRLLAGVNSSMWLQMMTSAETSATTFTKEWPFACMNATVLFEVGECCEHFDAVGDGTVECFAWNLHLCLSLCKFFLFQHFNTSSDHHLDAIFSPYFRTCMQAFMCSKAIPRRKRSQTAVNVTFVRPFMRMNSGVNLQTSTPRPEKNVKL